jgi:hypothetical protein
MGTLWAYRRIIGVGIAVAAAFAFYILVIAPAVFAPGARRPTSAAIGGLFVRSFGVLVPHPFCTASVITSPRGNLLLTAAHCLGKVPDSQIVFIPYYYGGTAPFGEWQVTRSTFAGGWLPGGSISSDYAFLTVSGDVQRKAGAERLGTATPLPRDATLEGYNLDGTTTVCAGHPERVVREGRPQLRVACPGFSDASSGGPFLTRISPRSGTGTIIGVIGGYQQGGATSSVSYAAAFRPAALALARKVARQPGR